MKTELLITFCRQAGTVVEVMGRERGKPDAAPRLLFRKTGALSAWDANHVTITGTDGLATDYEPDGTEEDYADLIEKLRQGDSKAIFQVFFIAVVLLAAWAAGAL